MTYTQVSALMKELRRAALDEDKIQIRRYADGANIAVSGIGTDWIYEINGVRYDLRHFEQALTLLPQSDTREVLQRAVAALNTTPRFRVPSLQTDSYEIAAEIDAALRDS